MSTKRILFIGDSITAARKEFDLEQIGHGYVRILHDYLITANPGKHLEFINKGVNANRISDLAERWQEDVLDWNPDVLSISIGINDVWRQLDAPKMDQIYPDEFERVYEDLLNQVQEKTNAAIVLMEPTVIEDDISIEGNEKMKEYVTVVHLLAEKFDATIVRTHEAFLDYMEAGNEHTLTTDGVHMNALGDMLIASTWADATKGII
ncbi:SGNH/GDSL hydrolase family protein [Virgibacillus ainsalahensis]